jgi:hypothetical protein
MKHLAGLLLLFASSAFSQTVTYTCKFPTFGTPDGVKKDPKYELRFVVDRSAHKAYVIGNTGSSEVDMLPNGYGISFLETSATGNIFTTTITKDGLAVHSRHTIILKDLVPTQYYGTCITQ